MQPITEMQFGRDDSPSVTIASAFACGQVTITVQNTEVPGHACDNELTLAQTIQLRDFLNRHIDGLALAATGSLAVRAEDDGRQLSAEELLLPLALDAIAPALPGQVYAAGDRGEGKWVTSADKVDAPGGVLPMDEHARAVLLRKVAGVRVQVQELFSRVDLELQVAGYPTEDNHHACVHPQRWLQSARMDVQTGMMKLDRAINNPATW